MNQDEINRDRILSAVHTNTEHIMKWMEKHDEEDRVRFGSIESRIKWAEKVLYGAVGIFLFIELAIKMFK